MAKQLNVNLAFSADTSKVSSQLKNLQNQLQQLTMSTNIDLGITGDIKEATKAAAELSVHLKQATNVETGTLDFTKLNKSITQSGKSLQQYGQTLASMGSKGQQAFMSLAQAVASSEVPIRRTNAMLKEMGTTLANTARWQLSSSILHGFMGAVQSAYGYAQDLNESLNNIRIVTGQSIDQMSRFAEEANKAARALSTTTTEYTNASLIYYQQGLNDQQVKERTDITVKMANVARQSAEVVSDQMTAVWNNFYDGSKSLEYYADVMTALGAATASSTDEIAGGLEKFAAIGQTIGLSYEYAASALATITSNTRQSEEVVGTALKTIFARIQGLNLGETLDDGTTLNKYSAALDKVGISIFDQQGELKKMDNILDELGAKWDTLNKSQQAALAQTVAGVRQYNQLISLMDNWDKGDSDSFQANLVTAKTSTGALQKQADIYAESWEAAQDRVRAAAEGVYKALLNDDFFIDMLNSIEKVIGFVDHLIDNLGGLKGVLAAIGAIMTKVFSDQIAQGITNMAYNVQMMTKSGQEKIRQQKSDFIAGASDTLANMEGGSNSVQTTASQAYKEQLTLQQKMIDNADKMTESEQKTVQLLMDQLKARGESAIAQAKELDNAKKIREAASDKLFTTAAKKAKDNGVKFDASGAAKELSYIRASVDATRELDAALDGVATSGEVTERNTKQIYDIFTKLKTKLADGVITQDQLDGVQQLLIKLKNVDAESEDFETTLQSIKGILGGIGSGVIDGVSDKLGADLNDVRAYADSVNQTAQAQRNLDQANKEVSESSKTVGKAIDEAKGKQQTWADIIVAGANVAFSFASALNMIGGAFDKIKDPDASGWEKFLTILTTLGMVIPTVISLYSTLKGLITAETVAKLANVAVTIAQAVAERSVAKAKDESAAATKNNTQKTNENTASKVVNKAADHVGGKGGGTKSGGKTGNLKQAWNQTALSKDKRFTKVENGRYSFKGSKQTFSPDVAAKKAGGDLLGKVKTLGAGMAWIAAGVAVAVGAIAWGIAQFNKQAKAAEEAALQANKAAEAYQAVAEAYDAFTANLDNYSNAKKGLEDLTKGTLEYREAVLKANEAAMELINNNEGLQYTVDNDGLIQINEESLKIAQEQQLEQLHNAQMSSMLASQNARDKKLESDKTNFARSSLDSKSGTAIAVGNAAAAAGAGAGAGALIGTGLGTIFPGLGNILGGLGGTGLGAIIGGVGGLITGIVAANKAGTSSDREKDALDKLAQVYQKEGNARFADDKAFEALIKEQGITDTTLIDSLVANRESTMKLVAQIAENTEAISSMNEQMVSSKLGDKLTGELEKFYSSTEDPEKLSAITKETTEAMGVALEKRAAELYDDEFEDQMGGLTDAEIQKRYAEAMGWSTSKTENKNGNKATYYDKEGNIVAEDLSDEVARKFLAQQEALKQLEGEMPIFISAMNSLTAAGDKLGEGIGVALASFAGGDGGNLSTLTQDQFATMSEASLKAKRDDDGNVISFTYNGEKIDDEKAQTLGYENAAAFYEAFKSEIKRVKNAWEDIKDDIEAAGLNVEIIDDMDLATAEKFQKSLEQMNYGALGDEGAKKYAEGIDAITKSVVNMDGEVGMGEADLAKFIEKLNDVDWSNWYAMEDVNSIISDMGYELGLTEEQLQSFIETMRQVGGASPVDALKRTWENATILADELSKGIPPGSILDESKYQAVIQSNAALKDQFMQMIDGTYKYVGDKTLDFANTLDMDTQLKETREASQLYANAKKAASKIDFAGLAKMDYVKQSEIKDAKNAKNKARDAKNDAKEELDSFHFLGIGKADDEKAYNSAKKTYDSAKAHLENLESQRDKEFDKAQSAVEAVRNNEYLKKVAEKEGWTDAELEKMLKGIKNGDDASMERMKKFASEMNKFMAAGDEGLYDVKAAEEKIASMATSIEQLDELTELYDLGDDTYAKAITGLFTGAADAATSLEELDEIKKKVEDAGGTANLESYVNNVKRLAEEAMGSASSLEELAKAKSDAETRGATVDMEVYAENVNRVTKESAGAAKSIEDLNKVWADAQATGVELDFEIYAENVKRLAEESAGAAKSFDELNKAWKEAAATGVELDFEVYAENVKRLAEEGAGAANSLQDLQHILSEADSNGVDIAYNLYADNLLRLSESYQICADEADAFRIALQSGSAEAVESAQANLEAAIMLGEAANAYGVSQEELSVQSKQLMEASKDVNGEYTLNAKQAAILTIQNQRMNKGVETLVGNWEDWKKELKSGNKTSRDWAKAAADCTKVIADLVGASEDLELPADFFDSADNMKLLEQAANGSEKAINQLGIAVAKAQVGMMSFQEGMTNLTGEAIDATAFDSWKTTVLTGITSLQEAVANGLAVGTDVTELLGKDDWVTALNEMAAATNMSVDEMNSMLNSLGVEANVEVAEKTVTTKVPKYTTVMSAPVEDEQGNTTSTSYTYVSGYEPVETVMQVASIGTEENPPKINFVGNGNVSDSAKNGDSAGSNSTTKTKDSRQKKTDVVDRYKEINDELEETGRLMNKNSTLAEGLYGAARIAKLRENVKLMEQENKQLSRKYELAKQYLKEDTAALNSAASAAGVKFTFNDDGNISNYTEQMTALFNAREKLLDSFGSEMNEKEQKRLEEFDAKVEELKAAYQQYETTLDEKKDMEEEHLEKMLAIQQEYYNILTEELEVKLSINKDDLDVLEYYLDKISDDFFQMAEAAALMVGSLSTLESGTLGGQLGNYLSNLDYQKSHMGELEKSYTTINPETGATYINQQQYVEGLRATKDAILENLKSINALDESMMHYYGDTLAAGAEELAKYTDKMEQQNAVLDHYASIMDILGKSKDFVRMGVILEAQAKVIGNEAKVAKENYDMLETQAKARKAEYDAALAAGAGSAELELLQKQWWDAESAASEAQSNMMSKTEEWAQAMKAVIENELSGLAQTLENALTADFGGSFDAMANMLTRANSLQEEYLTTTNQIYETNKMMRTAQQEIDKSTNSVAKRKLKSFIDETEQLQNQSKLSKYELEIQQAKYDLLLAEIALEEASNAKSTVRLQRDSEGNFGYVYTADNNAVDAAQQKFEDAQNSLYNIGLEGANQYTEKYQQTLSEFYDTMTELQNQHLNGEFENEAEYQEAMASARQYYYEKLKEYSSLYSIALTTDGRVVEDAWSTQFQNMTFNTNQWMLEVDGYVTSVQGSFSRWEEQMKQIEEETIGKDLDALKEKTQGITDASDDLVEMITKDGGVIESLENEYTAVANLTGAYGTLRDSIKDVVLEYESMLGTINAAIEEESKKTDVVEPPTLEETSPSDTTTPDDSGDSGNGSSASWDKVYGAYRKINAGAWGHGVSNRVAKGMAEGFTEEEVRLGQQLINKVYGGMTLAAAKSALGFDTGGYTGDWSGSYGKMAFLHQKELVLNAGDTDNFLAGMELLDKIVQAIDLYSMNAQLGGLLFSPSYSSYGSGEVLEQQVHIEASFPNVTDRHEIEDALNTLVNRASQYASRK